MLTFRSKDSERFSGPKFEITRPLRRELRQKMYSGIPYFVSFHSLVARPTSPEASHQMTETQHLAPQMAATVCSPSTPKRLRTVLVAYIVNALTMLTASHPHPPSTLSLPIQHMFLATHPPLLQSCHLSSSECPCLPSPHSSAASCHRPNPARHDSVRRCRECCGLRKARGYG